jgi:hypothetical protein
LKKTRNLSQTTQELWKEYARTHDSIKRPNLRIMGIEEEEVQVKGLHNILNKMITENFPNLKKNLPHSDTGSLQDTIQT